MNFPIVFDYFCPFLFVLSSDRGFPVLGEVRAPNVFSSSTMTVQLSFLKEQQLMNHSFLQVLEFRENSGDDESTANPRFRRQPMIGLGGGAHGNGRFLAIPAAFAAIQPFPALFLYTKTLLSLGR
ncbi:hypothetical protein OS493_016882 [Desmophyllum pertusum]|uniref:Uncharacterized protein n=1 Tax=Desmophyllum pertusum TaxID=174260 RepID=A0A9W9YNV7_9CNID|nr:hypothetical protein OS493_016882 [Desmophyllum pertusum]